MVDGSVDFQTFIDQNRQRAVADGMILPIINQLRDSRLTETAIPVLYNICNDYGTASDRTWTLQQLMHVQNRHKNKQGLVPSVQFL